MATTLAQQLSDFAVGAFRDGTPDDVTRSSAERVLDVVGLSLGAAPLETSQAAFAFAQAQRTTGQSTAIGFAHGMAAPQAAFVNGVLAHSLDFDDTHLPSVLHPSAAVVPAVLAMAQETAATGEEVVRAVAAGLEVVVRTGMAGYSKELGNSVFFEHGQHATSICGTLGAAVGAALIRGLDVDGVRHSLGLAASMSSGIIEANRTGGTVKRIHCGWSAQAGVSAAALVAAGFTGPPTVLEGRFGFYEAFLHGEFFPEAITEGLGQEWSVPGIFFKPYPCNHFAHALVDAGIELRNRGVNAADVARFELGVPSAVIRTIGEPIDEKRAPKTGYQAQFSGPYTFVSAFLGGGGLGLGRDDFRDELVNDPEKLRLMAICDVIPDADCDRIFPHQFPARVTATLQDGRKESVFIDSNRGGPQRPLSREELRQKFLENAQQQISMQNAEQIAELCGELPAQPSVTVLLSLTVE